MLVNRDPANPNAADIEEVNPTVNADQPPTTTNPNVNEEIEDRDDRDPNLLPATIVFWSLFGLIAVSVFPFFSLIVVCMRVPKDNLFFLLTGIVISLYGAEFIFMIFLICINNTWSFYGMLSERWNPVAYLTSHFYLAYCYFTSAVIGAVWAAHGYRIGDEWKIVLGILSPLIFGLLLTVPPYIDKAAGELYMTPQPFSTWGMTFLRGTRDTYVPFLFPGMDMISMMVLHYFFLGTAFTFAWAVMIWFLNGSSHFHPLMKLAVLLPLIAIAMAFIIALCSLAAPKTDLGIIQGKQMFHICIYGMANMTIAGLLAATVGLAGAVM